MPTDHVSVVTACVGLSRVCEYISLFHEIITTHKILQWLKDIGTSNTDRVNPSYEA